MTRVVIFGSRLWDDQPRLDAELDRLHAEHRFSLVLNGGQRSYRDTPAGRVYFGADYQALIWARSRGIPERHFQADWKRFGRAAGPLRNQRMIDEGHPELGIQFPKPDGSWGAGTKDMRWRLDADRIPVIEIRVSLAAA